MSAQAQLSTPVVTRDDFPDFLSWLVANESMRVDEIISVVEKPHKYQDEYQRYRWDVREGEW